MLRAQRRLVDDARMARLMNKDQARGIVYRMTARSLRAVAENMKRWDKLKDIPMNLSAADKAKVQKEMLGLADRLDGKAPEQEAVT